MGDLINKLRYSAQFVESEKERFFVVKYDEKLVEGHLGDFSDFIVLGAAIFLHQKMLMEHHFYKIADKIDAYIFAYEDGLLDEYQVYNHLMDDFEYIVTYFGFSKDLLVVYK